MVVVEGYCYNVLSGQRRISVWVKNCIGVHEGIPQTGWNGISQRLIVEEFRPQSNVVKGLIFGRILTV